MSMIKIDGQEYDTELMSVAAKENLQSVQFVDNELQRLQARAAVLQIKTRRKGDQCGRFFVGNGVQVVLNIK